MAQSIIESPVLPDIDKQIEYIKHLRKDVIPFIKHLQTGLDMTLAIEQSLMAAKLSGRSKGAHNSRSVREFSGDKYNQILSSIKIKTTFIRVEVLKAIHNSVSKDFTISEIYKTVAKSKIISRTAVISTITLFKAKGIIHLKRNVKIGTLKRLGRPETRFQISQNFLIQQMKMTNKGC
jgi:hypothetical protein